jgi:hypothetical protein
MNAKWFSIVALIAAATFFLSLSSCGFNQHLVSITISPSSFTFGGINQGLYADFAATGTYEHPPKTVDITNIVTWGTDAPQIAQFTSPGVLTTNSACGTASISASFYDSPNLVSSNPATITVDGPTSLGCTEAGTPPILTVNFSGTATGTVVSSPAGIDCSSPSSCNAEFTVGTTVILTGTPTGSSTSVTWNGCGTAVGETCTVTLEESVTVTATFQQ